MTEDDLLRQATDRRLSVSERLSVADDAVKRHPDSTQLWCILGDLIQLDDDEPRHSLADAKKAYQKALQTDANSVEALESLAHYCDTIGNNLSEAEGYFRQAISNGAGALCYASLARVLVQQGRRGEAQALLDDVTPNASESEAFNDTLREIENGVWDP